MRVGAIRQPDETLMRETGSFNRGDKTPQCARGIPTRNVAVVRLMEKRTMVNNKSLVPVAERHALRRGVILSSVAGLAIAAVVAAPLAPKTSIPTLVSTAAAAETTHTPDSFADLVARVKP